MSYCNFTQENGHFQHLHHCCQDVFLRENLKEANKNIKEAIELYLEDEEPKDTHNLKCK